MYGEIFTLIYFFISILIAGIAYLIYIHIRNKLYTYKDWESITREISCSYNPSIASVIFNNKVDINDLVADVMNLYARKYIEIEKKEKLEINISSKVQSFDELCESDKYIIRTIVKKIEKFNFGNWTTLVMKEYRKLDFLKAPNKINILHMLKYLFLITILMVFIFTIVLKNLAIGIVIGFGIEFWVGMPLVFLIDWINEKGKSTKLNSKGKQELKKWIGFKNFIKDYTNVSEKNFKDIILYEKYIPYAVALGENYNTNDLLFNMFTNKELEILLISKNSFEYNKESY